MNVELKAYINFDNVNSVEEAYAKLQSMMKSSGLTYRTGDEYYVDGNLGDPHELTLVIFE